MRGLENEFARFSDQALGEMPAADIAGAKSIFMCGAMAATARILGIIFSGLPDKKRAALLRRVEREAYAYQQSIKGKAKEGTK